MKKFPLVIWISITLAVSACGGGAAPETNGADGGQDMATSQASTGSNGSSVGAQFHITVPDGWVGIEEAKLGTNWKQGYDNSATNPTIRMKFNDDYGDNSNVQLVSGELFGQANFGDSYGTDVTIEHREFDHRFDGSDDSIITVFKYISGNGSKMRGCWWVLRNAKTYEVAVVEVHGRQSDVTDGFLKEIEDTISFSDK